MSLASFRFVLKSLKSHSDFLIIHRSICHFNFTIILPRYTIGYLLANPVLLKTMHHLPRKILHKIIFLTCSTQRECNKETVIRGITVHEGTVVVAPTHAIHYDPKIWPEPERFNPWRFTPEEKGKHSSYDWLPFGAGPRNCLAMRLALLEVKVAVAHLVQKYKFVRSEKTEVNSINLFCLTQSTIGANSKRSLLISEKKK